MDAIFNAVMKAPDAVAQRLRLAPESCRASIRRDRLVASIPHWLYVGDTPLHLAAAAVRLEGALQLLDAGAEANVRNRRGATPLHYACDPRPNAGAVWSRTGQAKLIRALVERGAELNIPDRSGATPLLRAVRARSPGAVRELLRLGADAHLPHPRSGATPLDVAHRPSGASGTSATAAERAEIIALLGGSGARPRRDHA